MRCPKCHAGLRLSEAPSIFIGQRLCSSCGSQLRVSPGVIALLTTLFLLCWSALKHFEWFSSVPWWLQFVGYVAVFYAAGIGAVACGAIIRHIPGPSRGRYAFYLLALIVGCLFTFFAVLSYFGSAT
jgi:hypothetical protein